MRYASSRRGFTLIELLTVIAIIAVLAAILFPLAGTVREQARASDCMSKLHQLWVSASVYKQDEGAFPPALMGYAENPDGSYYAGTGTPVPADRIINGFLYGEQIRNIQVFQCPDNTVRDKSQVTIAFFPPKPANWPSPNYIGDVLANLCGTQTVNGQNLTVDCFTDGPYMRQPKYYYKVNAYDIGPYIDPATGQPVPDVFVRHYSRDWTGVDGITDLPDQLKYANPPDDKTMLTYCTWHVATAKVSTVTIISMAGTAKKLELKQIYDNGANIFNQ
jgi:prepilin-type N-terminal cleavage/methylation domain-containing protein